MAVEKRGKMEVFDDNGVPLAMGVVDFGLADGTITYTISPACVTSGHYSGKRLITVEEALKKAIKMLKPDRIYQDSVTKTTVVLWSDGTKTIVKCSPDEPFVPEFGVAMATMRKLYGSRSQFVKHLEKNTVDMVEAKKKKEPKNKEMKDLPDWVLRIKEENEIKKKK